LSAYDGTMLSSLYVHGRRTNGCDSAVAACMGGRNVVMVDGRNAQVHRKLMCHRVAAFKTLQHSPLALHSAIQSCTGKRQGAYILDCRQIFFHKYKIGDRKSPILAEFSGRIEILNIRISSVRILQMSVGKLQLLAANLFDARRRC